MKKFVLMITISLMGAGALAGGSDIGNSNGGKNATNAEKRTLARQLNSDISLRGTLQEAKKAGETCKTEILQAVHNDSGSIDFEAQINCSVPPDEYTGGGTVLMINVKGTAFSGFLDNFVITVNKAG
jgi:hypothetical protein